MNSGSSEKEIFLAALDLAPEDREPFLLGACEDADQKARIERLLALHSSRGGDGPDGAPEAVREFRVIRKLAEGGMGVVYLAHDEILDRQIALKVLADRYTGSETARARFYNEARAAGQIDNPAVARVFQYGESAGKHFIAMEYLDGGTLADWLTQHPPPQRGAAAQRRHTRQVASFVERIASALESAHTQVPPVIHRDVKPSNILLDAEGKPKLTDFGIARMASAVPLTLEGDIPGTPQYMSPEQASAESAVVDHRSDIFSLGVVLYELLTGQRPFDGDTTLQVLHELRTVDPPTVRSVCPWIPRDLATICHKALEKRPRDRYQSAIQLAADLRSWRLDEPILARPPSLSRRGLRKVRTHRLTLTAFVIVALVGVSVFLGVWARSIANQSLVRVRIDADISGSVVHIRRSDPETGELEAWPTARALPLTRRYPAGMYRVTIVEPDGAFGELDLLIDPAKTRTVSVRAFERDPLEPPATGEGRIDYLVRLLDADPPIDMHPVAPGRYRVGEPGFASGPLAERVQEFAPFAIDVHEVSNSEYAAFLRATGHPPPTHWDLILDLNHPDRPAAIRGIDLSDRPVVKITITDAAAYAAWVGKRLPTSAEWDAGTRGPEGARFPWGDEAPMNDAVALPDPALANSSAWRDQLVAYTGATVEVAALDLRSDGTPILHTLGNAGEWTSTLLDGNPVYRGLDWSDPFPAVDLTQHKTLPVSAHSFRVGLRAARSLTPPPQSTRNER